MTARPGRIVSAIALLVVCQAAGELISRAFGWPFPGPVSGIFVLLAWLAVSRRPRPSLDAVANWLITRLPVMFVPVAVGLVDEAALLARHLPAIAAAATSSTLLTLIVTGLTFRFIAGRARPE